MSDAWIVGGALRDELLGRPVRDVDIAVTGDPERAARETAAKLKGPVFRLSEAFGAWRAIDRAGGRVFDFSALQGTQDRGGPGQARLPRSTPWPAAERGDLIDPLAGGPRPVVADAARAGRRPTRATSGALRMVRLAATGLHQRPETESLTAPRPRAWRRPPASECRRAASLVISDGVIDGMVLGPLGVLANRAAGAERAALVSKIPTTTSTYTTTRSRCWRG